MSEAVNERSGVLMSIRGVTKAFGSNVVLKGINMDVKAKSSPSSVATAPARAP